MKTIKNYKAYRRGEYATRLIKEIATIEVGEKINADFDSRVSNYLQAARVILGRKYTSVRSGDRVEIERIL